MTPAETYERYEAIEAKLRNGFHMRAELDALKEERSIAIKGIIPEKGRGCTICYWSDKRAATIIDVEYTKAGKPKAVTVAHNDVICKDWYGNEYEILPTYDESRTDRFTLRRNGWWIMEGQEANPNHSVVLMLHYQAHSIDPSF